jgi:3-oxoacyl-[acyl-carrier protein] reductase
MNFKDQVALVTGGARGIGKAISEHLHEAGAQIAVCDVNLEGSQALAAELSKKGAQARGYLCDVSNSQGADACIEQVVKDFGRLDVLINNAGITRDGLVLRMTDDQWQKVIQINLTGTFNMTRAAAKVMLKARRGAIVNIASVVGVIGNAGQANYSASKAGVIGLTMTTAREFASRGLRVNAVAPGFIATDMTAVLTDDQKAKLIQNVPLGRLGTAEDVAKAVRFLASDEAAYITGQVVNICGGMVM